NGRPGETLLAGPRITYYSVLPDRRQAAGHRSRIEPGDMKQPRFVPITLLTVLTAACASATTSTPTPDRQPGSPSAEEFEAIYRARQDSALTQYTEADVRFMRDMIHHHAQAIEMSHLVPSRTEDAAMHTLAGRIIRAQRAEIATMQRWLEDRNLPAPEVHITDDDIVVHD